jgi:PhnB protein
MALINPYLNFQGNTEEAFTFYQSVFGGEFSTMMRFRDVPGMDKMPENEKNMLMHIALPVGKNTLMATDALESMDQKLIVGNNIHLSVHTDSKAEADTIYGKLSAGGKATTPMSEQFWGDYFGMLIDKFGIHWMINYAKPKA